MPIIKCYAPIYIICSISVIYYIGKSFRKWSETYDNIYSCTFIIILDRHQSEHCTCLQKIHKSYVW